MVRTFHDGGVLAPPPLRALAYAMSRVPMPSPIYNASAKRCSSHFESMQVYLSLSPAVSAVAVSTKLWAESPTPNTAPARLPTSTCPMRRLGTSGSTISPVASRLTNSSGSSLAALLGFMSAIAVSMTATAVRCWRSRRTCILSSFNHLKSA